MILSHTTSLWNIWRTIQTLDNWKMDSTYSDTPKTTEAHTTLQTMSTSEVATTYLLNGKLGR